MDNIETNVKRRFWQPAETRAFLVAYLARKNEVEHARKKKHAMRNILQDLEAQGVLTQATTEEMLKQKMKNLLRAYKASRDNGNKTGESYSAPPFQELMDDIFGTSPVIVKGVSLSLGVQSTAQPLSVGKRTLDTALSSKSDATLSSEASSSPVTVASSATLSDPTVPVTNDTMDGADSKDRPKTARKHYYLKWKEMQHEIKKKEKYELLQRIEEKKAKRHQEREKNKMIRHEQKLQLIKELMSNTQAK